MKTVRRLLILLPVLMLTLALTGCIVCKFEKKSECSKCAASSKAANACPAAKSGCPKAKACCPKAQAAACPMAKKCCPKVQACPVINASIKAPVRNAKYKPYGWIINVKEEKLEEYKQLHAHAWPEIVKNIKDSNIQLFNIYLAKLDDGKYYLFSYVEYVGNDFEGDMKKMGDSKVNQAWWRCTDPCQQPIANRPASDRWWKTMEQVFTYDYPSKTANPKVFKRSACVIGVKPEMLAEYKELHANPWPEVVQQMKDSNITMFPIFLTQLDNGKYYLFFYMEYAGDNFEADMKKMDESAINKKWWKRTDACQIPLANRPPTDKWWMTMEEVFGLDWFE